MNVMPRRDEMAAVGLRGPAIWGPALALLGLGLALMLGLLFREEVRAAVTVWDSSTAYNHCWLVLPVALWLAWIRRDRLAGLAPAPYPAAVLLAIPASLAWFAAERLGIMEGRQLALIGLVWSLFLGLFGLRVCRAMAAPLLYLVFLVPFGAFLTPMLQDITAWMIDVLLDIFGIPHFVDHLIIEIPAGTFLVAEACAGLRFLIAAIAFGALYAMVMFRSPGRRLVVLALSVIVPVVANGFRAFGIVLLGHFLGSAEAGAADHVIYGWLFFSVVILLLILIGLPFREDLEDDAGRHAAPPGLFMPAPRMAGLAVAGGLVLGVAASGPALATLLQGGGFGGAAMAEAEPLPLQPLAGCVPEGVSLRCGPPGRELVVSARLLRFPPRVSWAALGAARTQVLGEVGESDASFGLGVPGEALWWATQREDAAAPRALAIGLWLGGAAQGGGLRGRVDLALNSLRGSAATPVMVVVQVVPAPGTMVGEERGSRREGALLQAVLAAQGPTFAAVAAARSAAAGI